MAHSLPCDCVRGDLSVAVWGKHRGVVAVICPPHSGGILNTQNKSNNKATPCLSSPRDSCLKGQSPPVQGSQEPGDQPTTSPLFPTALFAGNPTRRTVNPGGRPDRWQSCSHVCRDIVPVLHGGQNKTSAASQEAHAQVADSRSPSSSPRKQDQVCFPHSSLRAQCNAMYTVNAT